MKRTKRKYTRKVVPDAPGCDSMPLKERSNVILPLDIQDAIKRTLENRERLGLFDDSKERWERAVRYWQR